MVQLLTDPAPIFSSTQITSITTALTSAITSVVSVFVDLLPVMAVICGVGFGIALIRGLFKKVGRGRA